eukprot:GAHX01002444.1.p1 GENE.GAHX01002444.1~~GAHX01002444.1.p1  ORF type:complete len:351 (-),score=49.32 GAHX01002444.1:180-1232(-)
MKKNETATDGNKLTTVKLNTDYFINFLMKKTDENSFSLKTSHHISSGMDMDYFWTCFHNFVNDSEGSYLPYELTDGELSHLFVRIDEVSSDHINETIHYMFRLGYVLPELKKRDDGTYVYSLCYANSFHETRIPIEYENFKENYSNILNLSKIEKQKLKTLFTVKSWKGILMDIADPITNYPFSAEENTFSEKDFERVFVRMLKTRLEVHVLLDCEKLTQKQLDLMIQVKGQVKKRKNPTATVNRSFAMLDVEAKIIIDYNAGERFHAIIELKKNAGNLTSMSLMLGSDKQYEEIRGLEGEKKVYIVASLNERGIPRHRTKVNERNMAFVVTDNIRNRNPMKGNNRRTVS